MTRSGDPSVLRYGVALVATGAGLLVKLLLVPLVTSDQPGLLFFAVVMVAAAFGGFGPGLLATALGAVCDAYFFMEPFNRMQLNTTDESLRLGLFVAEGIFISLICARMKSARHAAEEYAAEAHELEGQLLEISEAEQRRLGHDLHDGLGQQLTGIALMTRRLQEMLTCVAPPAAEEASKVCALAKGAVEWTRDLCRSLSPPTLESAGLAGALHELAAHAEAMFHVECDFEQHGETNGVKLPASVHLYRIAQEAVSNAVRHGHAQQIRVRLENVGDTILMQIDDDGAGIEPPAPSTNGMGLKIMKYRARMIGAAIEVSRRAEGGTRVACRYRPVIDRSTIESHGSN